MSIVAMVEENAEEARYILKTLPADTKIVFDMDTTFDLGPFYVTCLTMRHPFLEREQMGSHQIHPTAHLPVAIHIHERKFQKDHQHFITEVVEAIDEGMPADSPCRLEKRDITLVSDREFDAKYLFSQTGDQERLDGRTLTNAPCWIHMGDNVKAKMRMIHVNEEDTQLAVRQFKWMLKSDSEDEYLERKASVFDDEDTPSPWQTPEAKAYFQKNLDQVCQEEACTFRLREAGIPNPELGCTNNASESYNALLKRQTAMKNLPVSDNLLNFYFSMRMSGVEIADGYYQRGPYVVREEYKADLEKDPNNAPGYNIETVEEMKEYLHEVLRDPINDTPNPGVQRTAIPRQKPTTATIAEVIYKKGNVQLSSDDRKIVVKGLDGTKHTVSLATMDCTCKKVKCEHLRATLYKVGLATDFGTPLKRKKTTLKAKERRVKGQPSGKKKPRSKDTNKKGPRKQYQVDSFLPKKTGRIQIRPVDSSSGRENKQDA